MSLFNLILFLILGIEPDLVRREKIEIPANTFPSPSGEYLLFFEYGEGNSEYIPFRLAVLKNKGGKEIWRKADFNHTLADIADNVIVIGIDFDGPLSGKAKLHFYDKEGRKKNTAEVGFLGERAISSNNERYAILDGRNGLRVFNLKGEELFNLGKGNRFTISSDGKFVALADDEKITIFGEGKRLNTIFLLLSSGR